MGGSATAVTDPALRRRLVEAARAAGMPVRVNDYHRGGVQDQPVVATTADGEPFTAFGGRIGRADMRIRGGGSAASSAPGPPAAYTSRSSRRSTGPPANGSATRSRC